VVFHGDLAAAPGCGKPAQTGTTVAPLKESWDQGWCDARSGEAGARQARPGNPPKMTATAICQHQGIDQGVKI